MINIECKLCRELKPLSDFYLFTDRHGQQRPHGKCKKCSYSSRKESKKKWSLKNRVKTLKYLKKTQTKAREDALMAYGNKCSCCGESNLAFLTIDHTNNDGNKHRAKIGRDGHSIYFFLRKNEYPPGFTVLCYNCNLGRAKMADRICPHNRPASLHLH